MNLDVELLYQQAEKFLKSGELNLAIDICYQGLKLNPHQACFYKLMGTILQKQQKLNGAIKAYQKALEIEPDFIEVYVNLGCLYSQNSQLEQAQLFLEKAIHLENSSWIAYYNLGQVFSQQEKWPPAIACYQKVIELNSKWPAPHYQLGLIYHQQGNFAQAVTQFAQATELDANFTEAQSALWATFVNWGATLQSQNQVDGAIECFKKALAIQDSDAVRLRMLTILPRVYRSLYDLHQWRRHLIQGLEKLSQKTLQIENPFQQVNQTLFLLEYQGFNDRPIYEKLAGIYRPFFPETLLSSSRRSQTGKIKIGFLSCYFYCHSVALCYGRLIHKLPRDEFEVILLDGPRNHRDHITEFMEKSADLWISLPSDLERCRHLILEQNLDILVYTDIGTDAFTYFLAMTRLAPVQCVLTGIPITSGLSTIDYYISSALMEPENAQEYYTETLIQLQGLPMDYEKPAPPPQLKSREQFGLSSQRHLYLCPMTIVKFHPDFDVAMAEILRQDQNGEIILFQYWQTQWHEQLISRWQRTLPDVIDRMRFLPWMSPVDFMNLLKIADVVLDTFHFSGLNTALMTLAMGTPMVTFPSPYLRGRFCYGLYRRIGILECVARSPQDYVRIACQLGKDAGCRGEIQEKILARHDVLYHNNECLAEMIQFFRNVVSRV